LNSPLLPQIVWSDGKTFCDSQSLRDTEAEGKEKRFPSQFRSLKRFVKEVEEEEEAALVVIIIRVYDA
jgi:hypothetical protein